MKKICLCILAVTIILSCISPAALAEVQSVANNEAPELPEGLEILSGFFKDEDSAVFMLFMTMQQLPRSYEWLFAQPHNPEVSYDKETATVKSVNFYLKLYANTEELSEEELRSLLEGYVDTICQVIPAVYPDVHFEQINIFWQIPAVSKDSLYAATFFCKHDGDAVVRGDGGGLIY